jgi:hypothetical protein
MAEFNLTLSDEERTQLFYLVQHALGETRVEVHRTHTPGYRETVQHEESVLRRLLDKLRAAAG